MIDVQYN